MYTSGSNATYRLSGVPAPPPASREARARELTNICIEISDIEYRPTDCWGTCMQRIASIRCSYVLGVQHQPQIKIYIFLSSSGWSQLKTITNSLHGLFISLCRSQWSSGNMLDCVRTQEWIIFDTQLGGSCSSFLFRYTKMN